MHLLVVGGLQEDPAVLGAHGKGVGRLRMDIERERRHQGYSSSRAVPCVFLKHLDRVAHLQHGLLVLAVLHLRRGEVEDGPLHRVPVAVVDVNVWPSHHHEAFHPAVGVWLQEVDVAFL